MSKDVILDKYARLYEIPNQLALLGHDVECFCLSYQSHDDGTWDESNHSRKLKWHSKSYAKCKKLSIWSYPFYLLNLLRENKPDVIIGASDMPHIIMGAWLAKKLDIPFVADLYDNFEAYGQAQVPFIKILFHHALNQAQIITATSQTLAAKIQIEHPNVKNIFAMPSAINQNIFKVGNKSEARKSLSLPLNAPLIGTAGGLTKMKGIHDLFDAWEIIKKENPSCYLVLAGPTEPATPLPDDDNVIYLGLLTHQDVATLFQALDVGVMCIPDDEFGRYCFPQKAYEMLACNLNVISSAIGDMVYLLEDDQLFTNSEELALKSLEKLNHFKNHNIDVPTWRSSINKLNKKLHLLFT
ncbi:glycosyltransferase family 4 protein [Acinetobacter faecalis]|uniref:Glycosyltransferase family 4 protein n=1 Tax=Acinetobacter faecalis TaxID=2665161 RepID=A0ABU5GGK1_9GAMM|nr:glycosyltransferase family 4 protein [Acinetobacter faecalis]MDY6549681.1 glycosyltransferase family 4 protein [Acinetobacter faecalis]